MHLSRPLFALLQFIFLFCWGSSITAEEAEIAGPASNSATLLIKDVILEGNTRFSDEELAPIITPYRGRALNASDIQALIDALTLHYISRGYLNSGVVVSDQNLSAGILRLQVIEGRLQELNITGNERLREAYIRQRVQPALDDDAVDLPVLNVNQLQQRLQLLEQDPLIERLNSNLTPGIRPGEAKLDLTVEEARPYYAEVALDNYLSPNVGDVRGSLNVGHRNLLGFGDSLAFGYQQAQGWESYRLDYGIPLNARNTRLTIGASKSNSQVVVEPFKSELDIRSETEAYRLHLRHPLYRTLTTEVALGAGFEKRRQGAFLRGETFPFVDSGPDGQSRVSVFSLSQELVYRLTDQVLVAQSRFDFGLDALDATVGDEPDGVFNAWLGQAQWLKQFDPASDSLLPGSQLFWRLLLRWTDDAMLSSEQFAIGGNATVRGYRENQLTRDKGLATSLEWRVGVGHWLLPGASDDSNRLQLIPFIDYGKGINVDRGTPNPRDLTSVGIGVRWSADHHWSAQLHWAEALTTVAEGEEYSLQDDGIHVQIKFTH